MHFKFYIVMGTWKMLENNILHNKLYKMSSFGLIDEKVLHKLVCLMRFSIIPSLYIYTGHGYKRDYRKGQTLRKDVSCRALWPSTRVIYLCMYVQFSMSLWKEWKETLLLMLEKSYFYFDLFPKDRPKTCSNSFSSRTN